MYISRGTIALGTVSAAAVGLSLMVFGSIGQSRTADAQIASTVSLATPLAATLLSAEGFDAEN